MRGRNALLVSAVCVAAAVVVLLALKSRDEAPPVAGPVKLRWDDEPALHWLDARAHAAAQRGQAPIQRLEFRVRPEGRLPLGPAATVPGVIGYLRLIQDRIRKDEALARLVLPPQDLGEGRIAFVSEASRMDVASALHALLPGVLESPRADRVGRVREYLKGRGVDPEGLVFSLEAGSPGAGAPLGRVHTVALFNGRSPVLARRDVRAALAQAARGHEARLPEGPAEFEILCREADRGAALLAVYRWKKAGASPRLECVDATAFEDRVAARRFDIVVAGFLGDLREDPYRFRFASPAWDLLIESLPQAARGRVFEEGWPAEASGVPLSEGTLYFAGGMDLLSRFR